MAPQNPMKVNNQAEISTSYTALKFQQIPFQNWL